MEQIFNLSETVLPRCWSENVTQLFPKVVQIISMAVLQKLFFFKFSKITSSTFIISLSGQTDCRLDSSVNGSLILD